MTNLVSKYRTIATVLFSAALISGCANSDGTPSNGATGNSTVIAGNVNTASGMWTGTGRVVINAPLSRDNNSYALTFTLNDSGSVALIANASNQLASGVGIRFTRLGSSLNVKLLGGGTEKDVSSKFTGIAADAALTFQVDIHNGEGTEAHMLVWSGSDFAEAAALLNSEEDVSVNAPGKGAGTFWGLELSNATVTKAAVSTPKFVE